MGELKILGLPRLAVLPLHLAVAHVLAELYTSATVPSAAHLLPFSACFSALTSLLSASAAALGLHKWTGQAAFVEGHPWPEVEPISPSLPHPCEQWILLGNSSLCSCHLPPV